MAEWSKVPGGGYYWRPSDRAFLIERDGRSWVLTIYLHYAPQRSTKEFSETHRTLAEAKRRASHYYRVMR